MRVKDFTVEVKAAGPDGGLEEGQFQAYASVFGNVDSYGDVVTKGAFSGTLSDWSKSGMSIPVLWGHDMNDPFSNIGSVLDAKEDDHGLLVTAQLDLGSPKAEQVYRLLKGRRINQMSFAYEVLDGSHKSSEELGDYYELKELKLFEVSVVPIGANQETEVLAVKRAADVVADGVKAGRTLSAKNEGSLRAAYEALGNVLSTLETEDQKASDEIVDVKSEGSDAKVEDVDISLSAKSWEHEIQLLELEVDLEQ